MNQTSTVDTNKKKIPAFFIVIAVAAVVIYLLRLDAQENKMIDKTGTVWGLLYRYGSGLEKVCQKKGYNFVRYSHEFDEEFADVKKLVAQNMKKIDATDEYLVAEMEADREVMNAIDEDFEDFKKDLIVIKVAEEQDVDPEDVQWKDEYEKVLTDKQACELFDEQGFLMLAESYDIFGEIHAEADALKDLSR